MQQLLGLPGIEFNVLKFEYLRVNDVVNRPYVLPPGTPKERGKVLQKAFADTVRDPEFLADANRAKLDLNPLGGEEIEKEVKALFTMDPVLVKQLKEILR